MAWPRTASKNCSCSLNCLVDDNLLLQQVQACELGIPATWYLKIGLTSFLDVRWDQEVSHKWHVQSGTVKPCTRAAGRTPPTICSARPTHAATKACGAAQRHCVGAACGIGCDRPRTRKMHNGIFVLALLAGLDTP